MKKNLLKSTLLTAAMVVSAGAWAQTDVTSTYIQNADFSQGTPATVGVCTYAKDMATNNTEYSQLVPVEGWEFGVENGDSKAGALVAYGSGTWIGGSGYTAPVTGNDGCTTGNILGMVAVWTGTAQYAQNATLPAGTYTLVVGLYNSKGGTTAFAKNLIGFIENGGTEHLATATTYAVNQWTYEFINFTLSAETAGKFSLGYTSTNQGSGAMPHLFLSDVKLFQGEVNQESYIAEKTAQRELNEAKVLLQNEIAKAEASEDAAVLADAIAAAKQALTNGTTKEDFATALETLKAAEANVANLKALAANTELVKDASATNPIVTPFVVNGTFTDNVSGWTCTGGFKNQAKATNQQGDFTVPFFENWNGDAKVNKMFQTIKNIPNGTYKLKIAAFVNTLDDPNDSQYVFANDDKVYLTTGTPTFYEVWTVLTTNNMEIGLEQTEAIANWMGIDNVTLTYYGEGDVIEAAKVAAPKANWNEALAAAKAALADEANKNVTGDEKTALEAEIAKAEPTTAEGYDEATAALNTAKNTFTAAAANYNAFAEAVAMADVTLPYADPNLKPVTDVYEPATATGAQTYAAEIYTALRKYYESNAKAEAVTTAVEMTEKIQNPDATDKNNGWTWTGSKNDPRNKESWTDSQGKNDYMYFDGGNWGGTGWTTTMEQTISVPAGKYLLTAKGRSSEGVTLTMSVGENSVELPHVGASGNVFDRGWNDGYVEFETDGEDATILVTATTTGYQQWFSVGDFRLVQLKEIEVPMASAAERASLQTFIDAAAALTLGFDANEYAPYTNAKGLQLAETISKALQNENGITKKAYDELAAQVAAIQWVKNTTVMQPIYNGEFAEVTPGQNYPLGWVRTNGWGNMQSGIAGDIATAYYNQPGALRYGSTTGYNLPLKANTKYTLTVFYRSHEDNSNSKLTTTVYLLGGETIEKIEFEGNPSKTEWVEKSMTFQTTDAGNYLIELANDGNTWMTGVKLTDATTTGISTVSSERNNDALYNLQGQRVMKGQKGLFIQNGKKFFVK